MTLLKYPLTTLSVLVNVLCFIVIYLLLVGYWEDFVTTNVPTVGPMPEAIEKTIGPQHYV